MMFEQVDSHLKVEKVGTKPHIVHQDKHQIDQNVDVKKIP